jgi:ribosomal protein S18 acetylase RimI-like enzyme
MNHQVLFKVRSVRLTDSDSLAVLAGQLGYPLLNSGQFQERLKMILSDSEQAVYVAETGLGTVCGFVSVFIVYTVQSEPFAELGGLVVDENHRGQGIGTALIAETEKWAKQRGFSTLRLRSRSTRTDAHRLYDQLGFERIKSQIVFSKKLS